MVEGLLPRLSDFVIWESNLRNFPFFFSTFISLFFRPIAVGANFFGDILQPQGAVGGGGGSGAANGHSAAGGGGGAGGQTVGSDGKIVTGDLDASLANLTSNLNLATGQSK